MVDGHAELVWCGLKISGLMDPDEASPGAQDLRYEGRSSVEMAEHTSPTFFLFPSLTIAWALWVLEGLHLLALKGFSREQLHVSTIFWVLMALPLKVTWSLWVPSGVWEQTGCPWLRGNLFVECKKRGILWFHLTVFSWPNTSSLLAGVEAINPHRSIPWSIMITIFICFLAYSNVSAALTLIVPYYQIQPHDLLPQSVLHSWWLPARYFVTIGTLCDLISRSVPWFSPCLLSDTQISQPLELVVKTGRHLTLSQQESRSPSLSASPHPYMFPSSLPDSMVPCSECLFWSTRWHRTGSFSGYLPGSMSAQAPVLWPSCLLEILQVKNKIETHL